MDWGAANNNGNLNGISEYNGGPGYPAFLAFGRSYTYDGVNRLSTVIDGYRRLATTGATARNFSYDAFGNMWVSGYMGMAPIPGTVPVSNAYDAATNRIQGQSYDAAGNVLQLAWMSFNYDAESRQKTAVLPGVNTETYLYDGEGRRVEKMPQSGLSTVYVYDAFGQIASEYTLTTGGTPPCQTCYLSWDHLGSTRLVTDQAANIVARHDYLPFGEEIPAGVAGRDTTFGASDFVNQKFTGKERDQESGLDYFGARYFSGAQGRYTGPDEPFADQRSIDPQSWNLYTYARNNPLKYIDRTGKAIELSGDDEQRQKQLAALQAAAGKKAGAYLYDNAEKDGSGNLTGRHFVGILGGGPSGKGPAFGSINAVAKDIAGVVADTQIAQVHLVDAGQNFLPMGAGSSPASLDSKYVGYTSPFNADPPIQIWLVNPTTSSYEGIGPWAMSNGHVGARTLPDNFLHELGHAAWQMDIKGGRQVNPADPYGNRRAVDFEDDVRRLRGGAERSYHDVPGDAGR